MKKLIITLVVALAVLPLSAFEIEVSGSVGPGLYVQASYVQLLFPDANAVRADFNFDLPHDFYINAQLSAGYPRFARAGVGFGKDFVLNENRSLRLNQSFSFSYMLVNCGLDSLTELTWHPYKKSGFFAGGGVGVTLMLADLFLTNPIPTFFFSLPLRVGYSFYL